MSKLFQTIIFAAAVSTLNLGVMEASVAGTDIRENNFSSGGRRRSFAVRHSPTVNIIVASDPSGIDEDIKIVQQQDGGGNNVVTSEAKNSLLTELPVFEIGIVLSLLNIGGLLIWLLKGKGIVAKVKKPKVSDSAIFLHNRSLSELEEITRKALAVDSEKFSNGELLLFANMKLSLSKGVGEYEGLLDSVELLKAAIAANKSFLAIEQGEVRYRGSKQQEFYQFVTDLLPENLSKQEFRSKVQKKLVRVLPLLKTDEGRAALESYSKELYIISEYELGLKLLSLFKEHHLTDFSILRSVSDLVSSFEGENLEDSKELVVRVIADFEIFEQLGPIIGIPKKKSTPEIYATILQYIGLANRHEDSYSKIQQLLAILETWHKPYQSVMAIRDRYKSDEYRLPKDFGKEIPGLNLIEKYKDYLE